MKTRRLLTRFIAAGVLVIPTGIGYAQADAPPPPAGNTPAAEKSSEDSAEQADYSFEEITDELDQSVAKGLAFLAKQQNEDGSFEAERYGGAHVGVTAICCLAFMANGELPGRGEYGAVVEKGLDYILSNAQESGVIASKNVSHGPMYGHGFATLFLGEVYGMTQDDDVRNALVKAVRLIVKSQNNQGGWRYQPVASEADLSVTICQVNALRSARQAGIDVPKETIENAIQYVNDCQNPYDGGFRYMVGGGSSAFPRSAAGVAALYHAGVYEGDVVEDGLAYLQREIKRGNDMSGHEFYGHYYCAQAMFIAGGKNWKDYFPYIRKKYIGNQRSDGSWDSIHGKDYSTGMSLIVLQMPYRLLPIFQR